jgi:hypothetical protein
VTKQTTPLLLRTGPLTGEVRCQRKIASPNRSCWQNRQSCPVLTHAECSSQYHLDVSERSMEPSLNSASSTAIALTGFLPSKCARRKKCALNSHNRQSGNAESHQDSVYFLVLRFREQVNALEDDLENGRNSDIVQRAKELLASFAGDPYEVGIRITDTSTGVKIEAGQRHCTPINPVTLRVSSTCSRCGVAGPFGDSLCPGS